MKKLKNLNIGKYQFIMKKRLWRKNFESTLSLFKNIVQDHMVSDVPIGSLLSGGLDSSLAC